MRRLPWLLAMAALVAPLLPQSLKDQAQLLYRQRKFADAAQVLEKHLQAQPGDYSSRLLLGLSLQLAEQRQEAEAVLRQAVQLKPDHAAARFYLGRVQYLNGKLQEAEASARTAGKLGEAAERVYNLIGLIRAEGNDAEGALRAYESAIEADPKGFAEPYLNAGVLLLKMGRDSEAASRLEKAAAIHPQSAEIYYHRARAYLELGRREAAERDLVRAASIGDHPPARRLLAQLRSGGLAAAKVEAGASTPLAPIQFRDVAPEAGLDFVLENHPTSRKHLVETMTGGVAAFDYDNDGLADIYFANGAELPSMEKTDPKYSNRLYRNEGGMKFRDVTAEAGVAGHGYAMGAAAGDFDNDGEVDLFVAGVKRNILYRNLGDGKFQDVTASSGITSDVWSVAAGWFDYDRDGLLDLFVVNYLQWSPSFDRFCGDPAAGLRVYCHPRHFDGLPNVLYRNRGDGTFEDVSKRSGIGAHVGKGMSVAFADYDSDGWTDVFVPNDTEPNFLFRNRGDGTFEEVGLASGVALNDDGKAVSSMGADFRDYDNDGLADISVTALADETFPLFRNQGGGFFRDATYPSRLGLASARRSGWSNGLFDFNNDGRKDLFTANSHVTDNIEAYSHQKYRLPNSVFAGRADGSLRDVSASAGEDFATPRAHRGAAFADFNLDGRIDVVVSSLGERAELWENVSPGEQHWIMLRLEGTRSNRDGIGARVRMGGQHNHMTTSVGYASSSHAGVHFGLGSTRKIPEIEIRWPGGATQKLRDVNADRLLRVREP